MDRLVDHLFVFEGDGMIRDFPGNYTQYRLEEKPAATEQATSEKKTTVAAPPAPQKKQASYKEKREFEILEKEIADLTREKAGITEKLNSGSTPFEELQLLSNRIGEVTQLLDEKELRWLELSEIVQ
jgi:ATP-binding cassette subfamily F protein uup